MAVEVKITMFGDAYFRRKILAIRHRAKNMGPVLKRIADEWLDVIEEQFASEGSRGGTPWAKLSRDTRFHRGSAHPILVDSADLLLHMTNPENLHVSDDEITLHLPASREVVAASHQYGFFNVRAGHEVPARPMVVFTEADIQKWRGDIADYLVDGRI
jgi:phage virion morphogenesis protein